MPAVLGIAVGSDTVRTMLRDSVGTTETRDVPANRDGTIGTAGIVAAAIGVMNIRLAGRGEEVSETLVACHTEKDMRAIVATASGHNHKNIEFVDTTTAQWAHLTSIGEAPTSGNALVIDVGATNTTLALVDAATGTVATRTVNSALSGNTIDNAIVAHLPDTDLRTARALKELLSTSEVATHGGSRLTRVELEGLIAPAVDAAIGAAYKLAWNNGRDVTFVLLVGGGADIPLLAAVARAQFGVPIMVPADPGSAAVRGTIALLRTPAVAAPVRTSRRLPAVVPAPVPAARSVARAPVLVGAVAAPALAATATPALVAPDLVAPGATRGPRHAAAPVRIAPKAGTVTRERSNYRRRWAFVALSAAAVFFGTGTGVYLAADFKSEHSVQVGNTPAVEAPPAEPAPAPPADPAPAPAPPPPLDGAMNPPGNDEAAPPDEMPPAAAAAETPVEAPYQPPGAAVDQPYLPPVVVADASHQPPVVEADPPTEAPVTEPPAVEETAPVYEAYVPPTHEASATTPPVTNETPPDTIPQSHLTVVEVVPFSALLATTAVPPGQPSPGPSSSSIARY